MTISTEWSFDWKQKGGLWLPHSIVFEDNEHVFMSTWFVNQMHSAPCCFDLGVVCLLNKLNTRTQSCSCSDFPPTFIPCSTSVIFSGHLLVLVDIPNVLLLHSVHQNLVFLLRGLIMQFSSLALCSPQWDIPLYSTSAYKWASFHCHCCVCIHL